MTKFANILDTYKWRVLQRGKGGYSACLNKFPLIFFLSDPKAEDGTLRQPFL